MYYVHRLHELVSLINFTTRIIFCKNYLWQLQLVTNQNNAAVGADIVSEMRLSSGEQAPVFSFNAKSSSKGDCDNTSRYSHTESHRLCDKFYPLNFVSFYGLH